MTEPGQMRMWLAAVPAAMVISWWPVGCAPEPAKTPAAPLMQQKQAAADAAVADLEKMYARMPDSERDLPSF